MSIEDAGIVVSIHAPREGRDVATSFDGATKEFQSTRPARGATIVSGQHLVDAEVSIHAPREGRDAGYSNMFY